MGYWLDEYAQVQGALREQQHNGVPLSEHPHYDDEQSEEDYSGRNIVFLDVDGVLNCMGTTDMIKDYIGIDDTRVTILKEIVDIMDARIVLISSWKGG